LAKAENEVRRVAKRVGATAEVVREMRKGRTYKDIRVKLTRKPLK